MKFKWGFGCTFGFYINLWLKVYSFIKGHKTACQYEFWISCNVLSCGTVCVCALPCSYCFMLVDELIGITGSYDLICSTSGWIWKSCLSRLGFCSYQMTAAAILYRLQVNTFVRYLNRFGDIEYTWSHSSSYMVLVTGRRILLKPLSVHSEGLSILHFQDQRIARQSNFQIMQHYT
jgi:hypothetical protein